MIEDEEQPQLLDTIGEYPNEEVGTIEEDIYVLGVESLNGKTGDLSIKTINGEDLVEEGNIDLQTPLDSDQMAAVNSGIDQTKVSQIATNADNITTLQNTKQDKLTQTQLNAVNSGIDQTKVAQIATNTGNITSNTNRITTIEGKIPSAASSSNQLTDKNYVDNSIATNTANYISDNGMPFQSYADLEAYSGPLTNNDYAFVVSTDAAGNLLYTRYKYNASQELWAEEYTIANPTFTADQWAAINSGVTQNDVNQINTNKGDIAGLQTSKQDALSQTQLDAINSGIDATKVQQISDNTTAIATKQDKLVAGANIQIGSDGKTISATDTTYTAGTGLTLTGTQFSVTEPVPAGFFTDTAAEQTGTGSSITLNNTVDAPIDKAELKGDTYQQTYSGKNLFGTNSIYNTYRCSASLSNNVLTVTPAGTGDPQVRLSLLTIIPAGTYTLNSSTFLSKSTQLSAVEDTSLVYNFNSAYSDVHFTTTVAAGKLTLNWEYPGTTEPFTIDLSTLQIEAGSTATTYEPYVGGVPSPNPSYPQQIDTVTGEQTVEVRGKNWFNPAAPVLQSSGATKTVIENGVRVTTSNSGEYRWVAIPICKRSELSGKTVTLKCNFAPSASNKGNIGLGYAAADLSDRQGIGGISTSGSARDYSITDDDATRPYLYAVLYSNSGGTSAANDYVDYTNIQLEIGSTATAYEPYQAQTYKVNLGKNVLDSTVYYSGTGAYSPSVGDTIPNTFSPNVTSAFADDQLSISTTVQWGGVILITRSLTPGTYHIGAKVTVPSGNNARVRYHILNNANKVLEVGDYSTTAAGSTKVYDWSITLGTGETRIALAIVTSTEGGGSITATDLQIEAGTTATTYAPYFTPIELCKLGTYQDYIWKDGSDWKIHKAIGKVILDGSESWENWAAGSQTNTMAKRVLNFPTGIVYLSNTDSPAGKLEDTHFQLYAQNGIYNSDIEGMATNTGNLYVRINKTRLASVDSTGLKTWFSTHNTTVYYALATTTDTTITDATLIAQLEALAGSRTYSPQTNYSVLTPTPNLPAILTVDVFKNNYAGLLARLEKEGA